MNFKRFIPICGCAVDIPLAQQCVPVPEQCLFRVVAVDGLVGVLRQLEQVIDAVSIEVSRERPELVARHALRQPERKGLVEGLRRLGQPNNPNAGSALFTAGAARRLAERLSNLRGAAMKLGQLISLQGEDVLPPEFAQALAVLRSSAAPMPPDQLHRVLGREYGKGWERRFTQFNDDPIAAASIAALPR